MKKLITTYTFVASAKTLELSDYGAAFDIKGLLLVVNVTDNIVIYNFAVDGLGHSSVTDDVVTLELAAITSMSNGDELLIYYDDGANQVVELGTTDNAVLDSMDAYLAAIITCLDGSEMQADIVASLPAGTNAIGKLSANSGVDIGDVDVTSLPASTNTIEVVGDAAENAAVAGNPVLVGGRYDSSPRSLGNGDAGAIALTSKGEVQTTGAVTGSIAVTNFGSSGLATDSKQDTVIGHVDGIETLLGTIDADTGNLAHTVDGNYLNTNLNIAGTDVDGSSGNKSAATQRVAIATDDIPIALVNTNLAAIETTLETIKVDTEAIETAVELLDNAISGSEMQVDIVSAPTITVDGTVTADLSATDNAVLDAIDTVLDTIKVDTEAIETAVEAIQVDADAIETLLTAANVDHAANEALLTTIDADTNSIKTAVEILDNAIDGNEMQVDIVSSATITVDGTVTANLSATDNAVLDAMVVDLAAIEVLLGAANTDHAANEALLTTIDADTNDINVAANAMVVDLAAIEVLLTAANVDHAAIEVLLGTIDSDTNDIKVDMAAIEVLLTAANVDHAAIEALLTTIDADTGAIKNSVGILDNAISGTEMQVDVVAALPAGSNAIGKLAANSGVDIGDVDVTSISAGTNIIGKVGHNITGGADGLKVVATAGTDVVLGGDVDCMKIDIQAQTDNTGIIAVGFTGVDATEATGTGIALYAGDTYSLEVTNLNLIYIDATVSGEGVRYTYYT